MSPRRMDISSLLRDPSPTPTSTPPPHPTPPAHPASLLALLNPGRPPFLGLDALVHAASEERRRISAADSRPLPHPDSHASTPDPAHSHKRVPLSPSPSPETPRPRPLPSPTTSASPVNPYPTLRRQPVLHMDTTRPQPPFFPHRQSPQQFRPHTHFTPLIPDPDPVSPRYGHGPRMAGGIEILSNDSLPFQSPRPDLSSERADLPPPRLSPLSNRIFALNDDGQPPRAPREPDLLRDWPRSRPAPVPLDTNKTPASYYPHHPIRVWEDQPTPARIPGRRSSPPANLTLNVSDHTADELSPASHFQIQPDRRPAPIPDPQTHPPRAPTPFVPAPPSPVLDLHDVLGTPLPPALDPSHLVTHPLACPPSPLAQPALVEMSDTPAMSTHTTVATVSQSTPRNPSEPPPSKLGSHSEDLLTQQPDSARRSPELKSEQSVLDQTMMDVDEELLSLVEDHPIPPEHRVQTEPMIPPLIRVDQSESTEQPSSDAPAGSVQSKGPDDERSRASMPPPTVARSKKAEKDKAAGSKKKKDATSKPAAKAKQTSKPRAKPVHKGKAKPNVPDVTLKGSIPKVAASVPARSRSASVIPALVDDTVPEPDADVDDKEDDKLYCVCKTRYDEDRMMIACDRCDEWFHTLCVDIPDLEIDLVDQFICPPCMQKFSQLRTTWKRRCLFGLEHENPSSPEACHKPSRGAFSKYCSDDCGIKYMQTRITRWEKSGGARDLLWQNVKNAPKREGVVVTNWTSPPKTMDIDGDDCKPKPLDSAAKRRAEREVARLNARLEEVVKEREFMKHELDMVMWREKVVELASERAGKVDECGWDQRLCFGEEEWADFGLEVLESYEEERVVVKVESGNDAASATQAEWWCTGKKKCERHAGWQKLRAAEVSFDKETKEGILLKLTTREREIRKSIEDILYPQPTGTLQSKAPLSEIQINGSEKLPSGYVSERGKKRT